LYTRLEINAPNTCANLGGESSSQYKVAPRAVFTHGPKGPGPRVANFQGRHIKKIEIEVWYAGKLGCPRERNLREIYRPTENTIMFCLLSVVCVVFAYT
jgi:hypothetical protein